jgi:nucleotide-binding universal stress UspA family protein
MFRRILVPLDGSERAACALPVAARLAQASGGSITLLRVVSSPIEFTQQTAGPPALMQEASGADRIRAADYLARMGAADVLAGVATTTEIFKGAPAEIILTTARSQRVDIIIMCSHGYTGMTRRVLGSVTERVAFHTPVPVLVLREGGPVPVGPHPDAARPLRMLVALDGSARAEAAIGPAASLIAALAASAQGSLHLTQVVKAATAKSEEKDLDESSTHKAKEYLSSTADQLREGRIAPAVLDLKLPITWSVALDADVAAALVRLAESGEGAGEPGVPAVCDMIAMATHGLSSVQHWPIGSITGRVLKATRLPLLVVRPLDMMERSNFTWDNTNLPAI